MGVSYPLPWRLALRTLWSVARKEQRSFRQDALDALAQYDLPLRVDGRENIPSCGPAVVVVNHYSRPGFGAWWIALAISTQVPVEMHWSMTAAWTFAGSPTSWVLAEISLRLFPYIAETYNFTAMPPMPPRPSEQAARALAVRRVLAAAKSQPPPIFGLAPEGQDNPGGVLMRPHSGVGRFMVHLARLGYPFYPVGVYEEMDALCLSFGPKFRLEMPAGLSKDEVDQCASQEVMQAIARQLPARLRGEF
jgi:1-acyl-sn-glycerol-3-phosphate acyltransferase